MQSQETTATDLFFKLWPWFEANWKRLAYGAAAVLVLILAYSFNAYRQNQKEIEAGQALTQVMLSNTGGGLAAACLKVATDYPATLAGQRARLGGATSLFTTGQYADAQTQFQNYLEAYPDGLFAPQAALGVAASLEAQGKTDLAAAAYQKAVNLTSSTSSVAAEAKFALARITEGQGKSDEAEQLYLEVARTFQNTLVGSEAGRRAMELKMKSPKPVVAPAPAPAPAAASPFTLSH